MFNNYRSQFFHRFDYRNNFANFANRSIFSKVINTQKLEI